MGIIACQCGTGGPGAMPRSPLRRAGFTLIEVVLAISIFAMVVAVIFTSLRLGTTSWEKGERDIEFNQRLRSVTELLYRVIASTYPYTITPSSLDTHKIYLAFFGKSDSLTFVSYANPYKRIGALSLIELWRNEDRGLMLGEEAALASSDAELDKLDLRSDDCSAVLLDDVKQISFRYLDRDKDDDEGQWVEEWDPTDKGIRLPIMVEVILQLTDQVGESFEHRLAVPIMFMPK